MSKTPRRRLHPPTKNPTRDDMRAEYLKGIEQGVALRASALLKDPDQGISAAAAYAEKEADKFIEQIEMNAIERRLKGEQLPVKACHKGCSSCCTQRAIVTPVEVIALFKFICETWSQEALAETKRRAGEYRARYHEVAGEAPDWTPIMCPLNQEGACSVYSHRPIPCRSHHSLDASLCERCTRGEYLGPLPQYLDATMLASSVYRGLVKAQDLNANQAPEVILGLALAALFDDPTIADRWSEEPGCLDAARDDALIKRAAKAVTSNPKSK